MKGKGTGWHGESRRHSLARKGIGTADGIFNKEKRKTKRFIEQERFKKEYNRVMNKIKFFIEYSQLEEWEIIETDTHILKKVYDTLEKNKKKYKIFGMTNPDWSDKSFKVIIENNRIIEFENDSWELF